MVLRLIRAQGLLSPHRGRQGEMKAHDGTIVTSAPDVMWGTDGVRVFTADDGWVWTFAAVDHWNAECVGWHECKVGSKPPTAESSEISPICARPSPSSSNATTSAGALRSWSIARRSKRARNTSYAMPRSANGCPRNRVRYIQYSQ